MPPSHRVEWETPRATEMERHVKIHLDRVRTLAANPVAVFDIDETLLINRPDHRDGTHADGIADNRPGHALFNAAGRRGIPTYVVTAREKTVAAVDFAVRQLASLGYADIKRVYLTPREYENDDGPARFKGDARAHIESTHSGTIELCVGDQMTDHLSPDKSLDRPVRRDLYCGLTDPSRPHCLYVKLPE